ncbi:MAG: helix-turn-helix transcriptional regulator, partial [Anaerolineae bacterium]|nr:helix-turn-helix transcriptional regulator [Anaerolineae bacterium]
MESVTSFGAWVQQHRKALHLTQAALAQQVGCAVVTIKKIEQELRRP